jgi:hypothetical protein
MAFKNSWNKICHEEIEHGGDDGHQYEMGDFCDVLHLVSDDEIFGAEYCKNTGFYFHGATEIARKKRYTAQRCDICLKINEHVKPVI